MERNSASPIQSVAIIEPIDDFGIGGYTYELAEGLAANGVSVDVYTRDLGGDVSQLTIDRHHRVFPVLGSVLFKQKNLLAPVSTDERQNIVSDRNKATSPDRRNKPNAIRRFKNALRSIILPVELAWYLKSRGYNLVWTQWPRLDGYGPFFWRVCQWLRIRVVHTVHNVLPHEEGPTDRAICSAVYRSSSALIVHSKYSARKLADKFPEVAAKAIVSRHGMYTMYRRMPDVRKRARTELNIAEGQIAFLVFGSIRPYKNTDAVLEAFQQLQSDKTVLIVAGRESRYPDLVPGKPLGRTERIATELRVMDRIRLVPGHQDISRTAVIFEAADVLILPYVESSGSGALLLGMTFGKYILATLVGGMEEYLEDYPRYTLLSGTDIGEILKGLQEVVGRFTPPNESLQRIAALEWANIASHLIGALSQNGQIRGAS